MKTLFATLLVSLLLFQVPVLALDQQELEQKWTAFYTAQRAPVELSAATPAEDTDALRTEWLNTTITASKELRTALRTGQIEGTLNDSETTTLIQSLTKLSSEYSTMIELIESGASQDVQLSHSEVITEAEAALQQTIDEVDESYRTQDSETPPLSIFILLAAAGVFTGYYLRKKSQTKNRSN